MAAVVIPATPATRDESVWNDLADAVEGVTFGAGRLAREGLDARCFERGQVVKFLGGTRQRTPTTFALTTSWAEPQLTGRVWTLGPHTIPSGSIARVRGAIAFETSHAVPPVYGLPASGTVSVRLIASVSGVKYEVAGSTIEIGGALRGAPNDTQIAVGSHGSMIIEGWSSLPSVEYYALEIKGSGSITCRVGAVSLAARLMSRAT